MQQEDTRARADPLVLHHQQLNLNLNLNRACGRAQIHWFSIINSCVTVLLLTGFLATILMRVLKNDFVRFGSDEETGAPPRAPCGAGLASLYRCRNAATSVNTLHACCGAACLLSHNGQGLTAHEAPVPTNTPSFAAHKQRPA